jgi:DNA-binding MarR family transcriptional regulator
VIAPSGLKATQLLLLNQVKRLREPTLRALADDLVMDLSALSHTLKPLLRDGLVTLVADASDRRAKHVALTPAGVATLKVGSKLWLRAHTRFEQLLGGEEARQFRQVLDWVASQEFADSFTGR